MNFIIELHDGSLPVPYWSDKKVVHPLGSWGERKNAKQFSDPNEAHEYIEKFLQTQAELCKVVPA